MLFTELKERVNNGEIAIVSDINGCIPETWIEKNKQHFKNWIVQDDVDKAGVIWIYDESIRAQYEYNPCKAGGV